jgi:hypothetical protein
MTTNQASQTKYLPKLQKKKKKKRNVTILAVVASPTTTSPAFLPFLTANMLGRVHEGSYSNKNWGVG